ncbi:MAG: IS1595 family transposase [Bacteroidota bacterium]|nr:IS1595 family transposase [Bacteroidota bacterium]
MIQFTDYNNFFKEEKFCFRVLKEIREQQGVICKNCENETHYWKNDKNKFECKGCGYRTSLKKGTIMENSNLPLQYWLSVIAYLGTTKENISALRLQKEIGHNRYEPILRMVKKIRGIPESDFMKQKIIEYYNGLSTAKLQG